MYEVIIDNGNSNEKHDILPRKCVLRVLFHKKKKTKLSYFFHIRRTLNIQNRH